MDDVRKGLRTMTQEENPGRGNLYDVAGYTVVVDFAHNPEALQALLDMANRLPSNRKALCFGQAGDRPGDMARPRGIAVDAETGVIYVVDGAYEVVQMFNLDAEILMFFGGPGAGPGQLSLPSGIALRGDLLAVADTLNRRVQLFRFLGPPSETG